MLAEARGLFEFNSSLLLSPLLMRAPKGDGHPVLTLPGFLASDLSMAPMRRYLKALGYDTYAWNMGRNLGGVASKRAALRDLLRQIHEATGRKVSIVGWSLGGVYARDLALQMPEMVRSSSRSAARLPTTSARPMRRGSTRGCRARGSTTSRRSGRRSPATCRCRRPRSIPAPTAS